jgi:predicted transcriptional regulator
MSEAITLQLPDRLYQRLMNTAQATQRSLEAVIVRALEVGAPPD